MRSAGLLTMTSVASRSNQRRACVQSTVQLNESHATGISYCLALKGTSDFASIYTTQCVSGVKSAICPFASRRSAQCAQASTSSRIASRSAVGLQYLVNRHATRIEGKSKEIGSFVTYVFYGIDMDPMIAPQASDKGRRKL